MGGNALASQGAVRCERDVAMQALSRQFMSSVKKDHPDMAGSLLGLPEDHIKALVAQHFEKMQCTPD